MKSIYHKIFLRTTTSLLMLCATLMFCNTTKAATFCVSTATELKTALAAAGSNGESDAVRIVQGSYTGNFVYASTQEFNLTIEGGYTVSCSSRAVNAANTVLDGSKAETVLVVSSDQFVDFTVDGLTLQNGVAKTLGSSGSTEGGGLKAITLGRFTLSNSVVIGNTASSGGGISFGSFSIRPDSIVLLNNIITGNTAGFGGGVGGAALTITLSGNSINNNTAGTTGQIGDGGGIGIAGHRVTLSSNTINNNTSNGSGGGMSINSGNFNGTDNRGVISNNLIINNFAGSRGGGGVIQALGSLTLFNNVLSNNVAGRDNIPGPNGARPSSGAGGGLYLSGESLTTLTVTNNSVSGNTSDFGGGGLYLELSEESTVAEIYNNIIWNNSDPTSADIFIDNDGDGDFLPSPVHLFNNDFNQGAGGYNTKLPFAIDPSNPNNANPLFVDAANAVYLLRRGSPAINAGKNNAPGLPTTDKNSNPRIFDGVVDIGAFEFQGNNPPTIPLLVSPGDGEIDLGTTVTLGWKKASDPDGDALNYDVFICENSNFSGCGPINVVALLEKGTLFAGVGTFGAWMLLLGVAVAGNRRVKRKAGLLIAVVMVTGISVISCGGGGGGGAGSPAGPVAEITHTATGLASGTTYHWKVVVKDGMGGATESEVRTFTTK